MKQNKYPYQGMGCPMRMGQMRMGYGVGNGGHVWMNGWRCKSNNGVSDGGYAVCMAVGVAKTLSFKKICPVGCHYFWPGLIALPKNTLTIELRLQPNFFLSTNSLACIFAHTVACMGSYHPTFAFRAPPALDPTSKLCTYSM
jgi:hypothetical protein